MSFARPTGCESSLEAATVGAIVVFRIGAQVGSSRPLSLGRDRSPRLRPGGGAVGCRGLMTRGQLDLDPMSCAN